MKKDSRMTLRKLLMLMAVISLLLVSLAGCMGDAASDDPSDEASGTASQTDPTDSTDAPVDPTEPEATDAPVEDPLMGTVTVDLLNVRSNPSTDSTVLRKLAIDTRVVIIEQKVVGDVIWGRITEGWINMNYVLLDGQDPEPTDPVEDPTVPSGDVIATGTITASELNIRDGYGTGSNIIGKYKKGDKVDIIEVYQETWARTDKGWISLKYVDLDNDGETPEVGDDQDDDKTTSSEIESDGKTKVLGYGVVEIGSLNVRSGPGTKYDKVDSVSEGSRYAYYQKSGNWVRIKDGWVSTSYFYIEGTKGDTASGTVTADLNIRTGPGTGFKTNGSYDEGDKIEILHQIGGWGYTGKGWISMKYVDTGAGTTGTGTATTGTGTVTASELNIRKSASKDSESVGKYEKGDKIEILEVKDGWGRTNKGWVSMNYVKMTTTSTDTGTNTTYKTGTATVVVNSSLTIRKSASASAEKVGSYENGDKVTITKVDGEWGQTDKGWINLKYVKYD